MSASSPRHEACSAHPFVVVTVIISGGFARLSWTGIQ
jgi:hypothetical protein